MAEEVVLAYSKPLSKIMEPLSETERLDYVVGIPAEGGTGHGHVPTQFIIH
jgi:hypothetical protein